jgi:hypothetical protein
LDCEDDQEGTFCFSAKAECPLSASIEITPSFKASWTEFKVFWKSRRTGATVGNQSIQLPVVSTLDGKGLELLNLLAPGSYRGDKNAPFYL